MGIDTVLKRFWLVWLGALVALVAYLQASGIGQLIAARLAPTEVPAPTALGKVQAPTPPDRSAGVILARNAFDSVTGPLDGSTIQVSELTPPPVKAGLDPYVDQPCSGFNSSLVTAAEDPAWSFASLSSPEGKGQLRRTGDTVAGATVLHIGWFESPDPDVVPRVWLSQAGTRCIVEMGAGEAVRPGPKTTAPKPSAKASKKAALTADIESKIKKVGENSYLVERSAVEQIIQNYAKLAGSLRTRATGEGMRLSGIKPDNILSKLGMKNGDVMTSINGFDMSDPDKAVDAYAKLRSAGKLGITVQRDNKPFTVDISIQK